MRIIHNILVGIALAGLLLAAGCNAGVVIDDDDLPLGGVHNEGGGGDV